jgi:hypothetical protein
MTCFAACAAIRPKPSGEYTAFPGHLALVVYFGDKDGDVTGFLIELDSGAGRIGVNPLSTVVGQAHVFFIGGEDGLFDDADKFVKRNLPPARSLFSTKEITPRLFFFF